MSCEVAPLYKNEVYFAFAIAAILPLTERM